MKRFREDCEMNYPNTFDESAVLYDCATRFFALGNMYSEESVGIVADRLERDRNSAINTPEENELIDAMIKYLRSQ
jgi:hypothetical protein